MMLGVGRKIEGDGCALRQRLIFVHNRGKGCRMREDWREKSAVFCHSSRCAGTLAVKDMSE
jgi:hypothetical protein